MKGVKLIFILALSSMGAFANAQEITELSCSDFRPTAEAQARFPDLKGACEAIVDRNGKLYAKFRAVVRRATVGRATLYLPATNHTFRVSPGATARVLIDGKKTPISALVRGQEIRIYLSVDEFAKPDIEEITMVTDANILVAAVIEPAPALPTTASIWPTVALIGLLLLSMGLGLRRIRLNRDSAGRRGHSSGSTAAAVALIGVCLFIVAPVVEAEKEVVVKPGRILTSTVKSMAIVESVNKETRELKLIDASGKRFTIVAGDVVRNFDQIEPRDRIVTEYLNSVAILVVPKGAPELGQGAAVEVAPKGAKPGIKGVKTFLIKAEVIALNLSDRIVTLHYEDGSVDTIKVAEDVPLDLVNVGDEVRLRVTTAIAISVQKADTS